MELVTMFCPLTTTGAGELVTQAAVGAKFVVDCNVKPVALVGHVKNTLAPEQMRVNCGANTPTVNTSTRPCPRCPPQSGVCHPNPVPRPSKYRSCPHSDRVSLSANESHLPPR